MLSFNFFDSKLENKVSKLEEENNNLNKAAETVEKIIDIISVKK